MQLNVWGKSGDYAMRQSYNAGLIRPYTIKKPPLVLGPCDGKIGWQASWRHEGLRLLPPARTRQAVRGSLPTIEVANPSRIANAHVEQRLKRAYSLLKDPVNVWLTGIVAADTVGASMPQVISTRDIIDTYLDDASDMMIKVCMCACLISSFI